MCVRGIESLSLDAGFIDRPELSEARRGRKFLALIYLEAYQVK